MTSVGAMSVPELLQATEGDFDEAIKAMDVKKLMETISSLQKEMAKEQENFNFLSGELQGRKEKNSRQYKQISRDMVASQQKLSLLMNRSMKCFSQQNGGTNLKRRNSAKGSQPSLIAAVERENGTGPASGTNIQRSKSMHAVNHPPSPETPHSQTPPTSTTSSKVPPAIKGSLTTNIAKPTAQANTTTTTTTTASATSTTTTTTSISTNSSSTRSVPQSMYNKPPMPYIVKASSGSSRDNNNSNTTTSTTTTTTAGTKFITNSATAAAPVGSTSTNSTSNNRSWLQRSNFSSMNNLVSNSPRASGSSGDGSRSVYNLNTAGLRDTAATSGGSGSGGNEGNNLSNSAAVSGGGGLYVKRKSSQPRIITTTVFAPKDNALPSSAPPSSSSLAQNQHPNSASAISSASQSSISTSASAALPPKASTSTSSSTFSSATSASSATAPRAKFQTTAAFPSSTLLTSSPLQRAQGVSKSYNNLDQPEDSLASSEDTHEFLGLPSVKLLARSFGSNTTLNVAPSNSSMSNTRYGRGRPQFVSTTSNPRVSRSSSSVCVSGDTPTPSNTPSSTHSSINQIYLAKGNAAVPQKQPQQQQQQQQQQEQQQQQQKQAPVVTNGAPQQQHQQRQTVQQSQGTSELEGARARLKTNTHSRDITNEINQENDKSSVASPEPQSASSTNQQLKEQTQGGYIKKQGNPISYATTSNGAATSSSGPVKTSITIKSINSADSLANSNIANSTVPQSSTSHSSSNASITTSSSPAAQNSTTSNKINNNLSNSAWKSSYSGGEPVISGQKSSSRVEPVTTTRSSSSAVSNQTSSASGAPSASYRPPSNTSTSNTSSSGSPPSRSTSNVASATTPRRTIVSTATVNVRRSKSREELHLTGADNNAGMPSRDTLLRQIQARRKDDENVSDGTNFKSMAKLSQSMPSLLHEDISLAEDQLVLCPLFDELRKLTSKSAFGFKR